MAPARGSDAVPVHPLDQKLADIVGRSAQTLAKARAIHTVGDLLNWLPRTYIDPTRPTAFHSLPQGESVVIVGTVTSAVTRAMRQRRGSMLVVDVADDTGATIQLTFFKPYGHQERLIPGARVVCSGQIGSYRGQLQLTHPDYALLNDPTGRSSGNWLLGGLVPVYPATPKLSPIVHGDCLDLVLHSLEDLPDPLPAAVRARHHLPDLLESYRLIHRPGSEADARRGRWRMKFGEAFVLQAALAQARIASDAVPAIAREAVSGGLVEALLAQLPFSLTAGQQHVLAELRGDLATTRPMNRLLQGEVGSGKTILAVLAMLTVIDAGGQAALLAPTEVLAAQHYRSIEQLLGPLAMGGLLGGSEIGTRLTLLTGSQSTAQRREALLAAASGEAGIVIGTHALIQEHVQFAELGLVVVDEQHRFGVEQRDALRAKASASPHVLVMTATPIPRTVAMTVYGDMTTSTLTELPAGRQPITTHVVTADRPSWVERTWQRVAEEVKAGSQVYVVCPRIGDPQDPALAGEDGSGPGGPIVDAEGESSLHGVFQVARSLVELPATEDLAIEVLHGAMSGEEKDDIMRRMTVGQVDVLVSTTVIEVGVDIGNATTMVVLDADRFGISQLHQLRGRVGRGGKPGLCLLVTQGNADDPGAVERLHHVASTTDGFELARLDLQTRREGDVLGARQSGGRSGLRFLRLHRDEELIITAREDAWSTVENDPDLATADHRLLAAELDRLDEQRTAYLERG